MIDGLHGKMAREGTETVEYMSPEQLLERMEKMREERASLEEELARMESEKEDLRNNLQFQEAETAYLEEAGAYKQTYNRMLEVQQEIEELKKQVESKRTKKIIRQTSLANKDKIPQTPQPTEEEQPPIIPIQPDIDVKELASVLEIDANVLQNVKDRDKTSFANMIYGECDKKIRQYFDTIKKIGYDDCGTKMTTTFDKFAKTMKQRNMERDPIIAETIENHKKTKIYTETLLNVLDIMTIRAEVLVNRLNEINEDFDKQQKKEGIIPNISNAAKKVSLKFMEVEKWKK